MSTVGTGPDGTSEALPPRQVRTRVWPAIGEREPEPFDPATWRLAVAGLVAAPFEASRDGLDAFPQSTLAGTIHCVTRWSRPGAAFRGVSVADLLARARPRPSARFVRFVSGRGHDTTLPLDVARADVLVATACAFDGGPSGPVPPEHGGPVRSVVLTRYFYKSVKWLRRIELLAEDRPGRWEREAGYHNGADPWREERYVVPVRDAAAAAALARRIASGDLAGADLLGAELSGRVLAGVRFAGASLRAADLRDADLRGADLSDANCTNADLRGADLRGARIDRIDLDGADLRGADLRGALGLPASLAATSLAAGDGLPACRVDGLDWTAARLEALLPPDEALLRAAVRRGDG